MPPTLAASACPSGASPGSFWGVLDIRHTRRTPYWPSWQINHGIYVSLGRGLSGITNCRCSPLTLHTDDANFFHTEFWGWWDGERASFVMVNNSGCPSSHFSAKRKLPNCVFKEFPSDDQVRFPKREREKDLTRKRNRDCSFKKRHTFSLGRKDSNS